MNIVKLAGTAKRIRGGDGNTTPWAFALIEVDGQKGKKVSHNVKAFGNAADDLRGFGEGDEVELVGHLERSKVKDSDAWETVVVIDKARRVEPVEEDIPF